MYFCIFLAEVPAFATRPWTGSPSAGQAGPHMVTINLQDRERGPDKNVALVGSTSEVEQLERALAESRERRCGTPHLFPEHILARTESRRYEPTVAPLDLRDDPTFCTRCGGRIVPAYPAPFCQCRDLESLNLEAPDA